MKACAMRYVNTHSLRVHTCTSAYIHACMHVAIDERNASYRVASDRRK